MSVPDQFGAIGRQAADEEAVAPSVVPDIAPLERFVAPPHLDGSAGLHRCKDRCRIDAADDRTAIEWWITRTSDNEATARSRRCAMEKLLNWACFAKGKAVSSLDEEDFAAFARFLAHPEPLHRWMGSRQPRESATWRPFTKPLTGTSRVAVLRHTAALVHWLSSQRYADLRFLYGKSAMDDGLATVAVRGAEIASKLVEALTVPEWHWIRRALDHHFPPKDLAPQRLIVELLYYGNLYGDEVSKLELRDFEPPNRLAPGWSIWVRGRAGWRGGQMIFAPPPLSDTVGRWVREREVHREGYVTFRIRNCPDTLLGLDGEHVTQKARQVMRLAASFALGQGDVENGMQLRDRSIASLRGAFAAHQLRSSANHSAFDLTRRVGEFGVDFYRRSPPIWDWRDAVHLWTESQNCEFRSGAKPVGDMPDEVRTSRGA